MAPDAPAGITDLSKEVTRMAEDAQVAGIDLGDAALASRTRMGMQSVEDLMYSSLDNGHAMPTLTASYLAKAGGKRFRPLMVLLAAQVVQAENNPNWMTDELETNVIRSGSVIEMIHLASLYHDDVMDEALQRHGTESANSRWGNSVAILAGDYLFAAASAIMSDMGTQAVRWISETFAELVNGQMEETVHAGSMESVEAYLRVIHGKTASLIATAGHFGAYYAGGTEEQVAALKKAAHATGMAFQIVDDVIDISSNSTQSGKTPGTDLREGVFTLPVLYALEEDSHAGDRLREILTGSVTDEELVKEALTLLRGSAGMRQARETIYAYRDEAKDALSIFRDSSAKDAFFHLVDFTVARVS